jgi:nitrate ABC transporter ATP-binding subunit
MDAPVAKSVGVAADAPLVKVDGVSRTYHKGGGNDLLVLQDVSLELRANEIVSLLGRSGSGKSTLLRIIAGLMPPSRGQVAIDGETVDGPAPQIAMVFQSFALFPWLTVLQNVEIGLEAQGIAPDERKTRALAAIDLIGLDGFESAYPKELSGGMRQRVGLARAFALDPKVLLLDEPFGMLDSLTRFELQQVLIDTWSADRKTALMVTHDVDEALFLSDRIALMTNGPAARLGGIVEVPFPRPRDRAAVLEHPDYYTLREQLITFLEDQAHPQAA